MDENKILGTIILRHDTSSNWLIHNPILALGEYGVEDDTHRVKRGDGQTNWENLDYEHFGLEAIITYENLRGSVTDNKALTDALYEKLDKSVFDDISQTIVSQLNITQDENVLMRLTKVSKNVNNGLVTKTGVIIKSSDNSLEGLWSIDTEGNTVIDLQTNPQIQDYVPGSKYFENQLCFFDNKVYRSKADFIAEDTFNADRWIPLTSLNSADIQYNNRVGNEEVFNIQEALDKIILYFGTKVDKSAEHNIVYGTDSLGNQKVYRIDDLRKVDTVNHKEADRNKNVQLDASDINYDDDAEQPETIKSKLDQKVDKDIVGEEKIVKDVTITYNETSGETILKKSMLSLQDGTIVDTTKTLDIASQTELDNAKQELTEKIDNVNTTLNSKIDDSVAQLNETINTNKIDTDNKINQLSIDLNKNISDVQTTLNQKIDDSVSGLNDKIGETQNNLLETINTNVSNLDNKINSNVDNLQQQITANDTDIININARIDQVNKTHQSDVSRLDVVNEDQEAHLTRLDQTTDDLNEELQKHAQAIIETNQNVSKNTQDISELQKQVADDISNLEDLKSKAVVYNNERNIDVENNIALKKNMMLTGATPTQYYNLASMKTYNEGLENEVIQTEFGTTKVHMNLNSLDRPTVELPSSEKHELSYKDELDTAKTEIQEDLNELEQTVNETINTKLEEVNQTIQQLDNEKIDKTFTNNLVNTLTYTGPQNTDLLKLNKQDINPNDNTTSSSTFTIRSSDNTLIAKPIMSGEQVVGLDLATNLDVDVHYFITSETLNTTIATENTIQISSLTDTTSDNVEVKDIVSDAEGTWARVQEVDTEGGTLKCVTFAKHAQAVWGTIKGNIEDQQDLQQKLDAKVNTTDVLKAVSKVGFGLSNQTIRIINNYRIPLNGNEHQQENFNLAITFPKWFKPKSNNLEFNNTWGDISFDVNTDLLPYEKADSGLTSGGLGAAVRELKGLIDDSNTEITKLQQNKVDKAMQELVQGLEASTFNKQTGELTINYDAFDVITNETTKKSIVISDMIKQSDLDSKIDKTNIDTVVTDTDITVTNHEGVIGLTLNKSYVNVFDNNAEASEPTFIPMISSDESVTIQTGSNNLNFTVNKLDNATYNNKSLSEAIAEMVKPVVQYGTNTPYKAGTLLICPNKDADATLAYLGYVPSQFTSNNTQATIIGAFEQDVNEGKILRIGIPNEVDPPQTLEVLIPQSYVQTLMTGKADDTIYTLRVVHSTDAEIPLNYAQPINLKGDYSIVEDSDSNWYKYKTVSVSGIDFNTTTQCGVITNTVSETNPEQNVEQKFPNLTITKNSYKFELKIQTV